MRGEGMGWGGDGDGGMGGGDGVEGMDGGWGGSRDVGGGGWVWQTWGGDKGEVKERDVRGGDWGMGKGGVVSGWDGCVRAGVVGGFGVASGEGSAEGYQGWWQGGASRG
ncbi:hypothetical protein Tco_1028374 [Tanacetum coccineum]|uniref:Uncharacterized protein n=1 Tax=Tanacetum coccineum TaxID=301880 RepID=A0ABQ5G0G4_9ASTR